MLRGDLTDLMLFKIVNKQSLEPWRGRVSLWGRGVEMRERRKGRGGRDRDGDILLKR